MDNTQTITEKLAELERRIKALEASSHMPVTDNSFSQQAVKQTSAKEFLLSKKPSNTVEKTLLLAYYLERVRRMRSFNISDVANVFHEAKEKTPANLNDMVNKNIVKGYIMEAQEQKDARKAWVLTSTGERFVEKELNS